MLVHALEVVKESAECYFSQKMQHLQQQHQQQQQQQHQQQHGRIQTIIQQAHQHALKRAIGACLTALPETVLLPPGQEDGQHRIPSVDRASLRAASLELRSVGTGIDRAWEVLMDSETKDNGNIAVEGASSLSSVSRLLECCESWARFVAVPIHVVDATVGKMAVNYLHPITTTTTTTGVSTHSEGVQYQKAQTAAFQYLVSIFEGASPSLTSGDILAALVGVGGGRGAGGGGGGSKKNASGKKKMGNKSKKRHEVRLGRAISSQDKDPQTGLDDNVNGDGNSVSGTVQAAEEELLARKNSACFAAAAVFGVAVMNNSLPVMEEDWGLRLAASSPATSTHGICSTVAACASSVLSHLLTLEREGAHTVGSNVADQKWRVELFSAIMMTIQRMCESPDRNVRALAYEPLMILHKSLNSVPVVTLGMEQIAVDAICKVW